MISSERASLKRFIFYSVQVSLTICTLKQNLKIKHSNVQWNVIKGVYFYWEKSTPQLKIELISGDYFFPWGSKFFPGKYYFGSTFFPGNYYSGVIFFGE